MGVTEISRSMRLSPATVFRSLDALHRAGLIARYRESSRYIAGPAAERLRRSATTLFPMRELCLPYLRQLVSISGEAVSLYVRAGWYAVRICSVPGTEEVTSTPLRQPQVLAESCAGRAILAFLGKRELTAYTKWESSLALPPRRLFLSDIRARGHAIGKSDQPDAGAVAFPVRTRGHAVAAVTIEAPYVERQTGSQLPECNQVIIQLETLAGAQPSLFENPFTHLNPESIRL